MDQELEQLIEKSFAALPREMQSVISTLPLSEIIQRIANKNGLHVDQTGSLYTEALLVLLGLQKIQDLPENLTSKVGIPGDSRDGILRDLDTEVFERIREAIKNPQSALTPDEASLDRNSVLDEIENPTPAVHPISAADQTRPGPAKPKEVTFPQKNPGDLVKNKLGQVVSMPPQRTNPQQTKPKSQGSDPYREPIQ
jgi:hypothetical protein